MRWLARLAEDLVDDGAVLQHDSTSGAFAITSYGDQQYSPPVTVLTSEEEFEAYLREARSMARIAVGGRNPMESAYELFWANLDELFATVIMSGSVLRIGDDSLTISPRKS